MPIAVYDYRTDVRNVIIMPEIRSRFLRMEPGEVAAGTRTISGRRCFSSSKASASSRSRASTRCWGRAKCASPTANQMHQVRTIGDQPMTMYLSVTPHIEPTHTFWDDQGNRLAAPLRRRDRERARGADRANGTGGGLSARHVAAAKALAVAATSAATAQERGRRRSTTALAAGDTAAAKAAVDDMSETMVQSVSPRSGTLGAAWNEIAATVAEPSR